MEKERLFAFQPNARFLHCEEEYHLYIHIGYTRSPIPFAFPCRISQRQGNEERCRSAMLSKQHQKPSDSPPGMLDGHPDSQNGRGPVSSATKATAIHLEGKRQTMWERVEKPFSLVINHVSEQSCPSRTRGVRFMKP